MMGLLMHDMGHHRRVARGGYLEVQYGGHGLPEARNGAVREYLETGHGEWLLWLDTDMGFPPDMADRLLAAADPLERPVVGALCFRQLQAEPDGMGGWRCAAVPLIYDWAIPGNPWGGFITRLDYPPGTVLECAGTGSGCILIHRSVFERIEKQHGPAWYDQAACETGGLAGEDLSFCARAAAAGIGVCVDTGITVTHLKRVWLAEEDYRRERAAVQLTREGSL